MDTSVPRAEERLVVKTRFYDEVGIRFHTSLKTFSMTAYPPAVSQLVILRQEEQRNGKIFVVLSDLTKM